MSQTSSSDQSSATGEHKTVKRLREYEATAPLDEDVLSQRARGVITQEINDDETRLQLEYQPDGTAKIRATQYVGIVTLPGELTIEIRPKVEGASLLELVQYTRGIKAQTINQPTAMFEGDRFVDALASLFVAELETVLTRGLHKAYRRVEASEQFVRGRLAVQRQIRRQGTMPTEFECTYDELTVDTIVNRAVLFATTLLQQFVSDAELARSLRRQQQRLRRQVELAHVRPVDLERVELNRLAAHYEDLFRLTKLVIRNVHVEDLQAADRSSFGLLVNMNSVFEKVVERAVRDAIATRPGWTMQRQATSNELVSDGYRPINIKPDVLVTDSGGTPQLVGDAKWKIDEPERNRREPSTEDIYQLVAYQVAHDAKGVLFYPAQKRDLRSTYAVKSLEALTLIAVPVEPADDRTLAETIRESVADQLPV
jgi:5-methylcytosine-specific restriction enzyme subunit McrC